MKLIAKLITTDSDRATIFIRFVVGFIFIMEGIQKFVYSTELGVGRFIKIGLPFPEVLAPFVGTCEIIFGVCILIGLAVRFAAIPTIIIMLVAITTTKLGLIADKGFLTFVHDSRNDLLMLFGCIFLFIKGAGAYSFDQLKSKENP